MKDMVAAMRRERDAIDALEADEADATLVEEAWAAYQTAHLKAAEHPQAPADAQVSLQSEGDVDHVMEFLEEMEGRQHGQGDWDAAPQKPEMESAERDVKSKRDRGST